MIQDTQSAKISQKQDGYNILVIMKTMCPPCYHHTCFVATHKLGHKEYGYTLLVQMNQRVLKRVLKKHSLVHWYQQCLTVHHVPKCMSCHRAIVVITGRAYCFHNCIYILRPCCFCEIWALCVSLNIYDHLYVYVYI